MTTDVAVGRPAGNATAAAGAAPRRTVNTNSIPFVVEDYVKYRSSLTFRRISNDSRQPDAVVDEDEMDGSTSDADDRVTMPDLEQTVRVLCREFEQRYEQAS